MNTYRHEEENKSSFTFWTISERSIQQSSEARSFWKKKKCVCLIFLLKTFLGSFLKDIGIWLQIFVPILEHEFTGIESLELCVLKLFETEDGAL